MKHGDIRNSKVHYSIIRTIFAIYITALIEKNKRKLERAKKQKKEHERNLEEEEDKKEEEKKEGFVFSFSHRFALLSIITIHCSNSSLRSD